MTTIIPTMLAVGFGTLTFVLLLRAVRPRWRKRIVDTLAVALIAYAVYHNYAKRAPAVTPSAFAAAVNLEPFRSVAVQADGRLKSFDSFARRMMRFVSGPHKIAGQEAAFTYLDMMFRPDAYTNADVIYVKKKQIRRLIADRLTGAGAADQNILDTFQKTGLIAPSLLKTPAVADLLDELEKDLIKTAKPVNAIRSALAVADPQTLAGKLRVIPPVGGTIADRWFLMDDLWGGTPRDSAHAALAQPPSVPGLDEDLAGRLKQTWAALADAWKGQDADAVNQGLTRCASLLRSADPRIYPDLDRMRLENWYFRWKSMTWIWLVYAAAVVPLLMSVIYHWRGARLAGILLFAMAFGLHTTSLGIRWYISGRIPNANMFEAITAATWFGAVAAIVLEFVARSSPMRNMFFLGAACAAMAASMCGHFMPVSLSSDIENIMPVLHDVWLYIHTNMIIASYALIAMAAVTALLYLRHRIGGGPPDVAILGGAGSLITTGSRYNFLSGGHVTTGQVLDGATMVLMELSFVTLWTGLVMGAIWADHSWGRPWGWDPKEVFALNTFIVFLLLVHVRVKVRDKGLWTAILATAGCGVMLFNWIVINFIITGLHSYA